MVRFYFQSAFAVLLLLLSAAGAVAGESAALDPTYSDAGADTCLGCHNSERMLVIFHTAHGQQADPASPMAGLQCEACHGGAARHADRRVA